LGLPEASEKQQSLVFPDTVLEVDGRVLAGVPRAHVWDDAIEHAWRAGRGHVDTRVQTSGGVRTIRLAVRPLEATEWWTYAAALFFAGALYVGAGLIALWANPKSQLARTFAQVGMVSGLFLLSIFDFHTTRELSVVFFCAYGMLPVSWFALALRLPDDAPILRRFPWAQRVTDAIGLSVAACFVALYVAGRSTTAIQQAWSAVFGASFLFFVVAFIVRFFRATGLRRTRLRALLAAVVPVHAVIGTIIVLGMAGQYYRSVEAVSYAALSLGPLAIGYAFVRHDLWGSRALLSRLLTRIAVGTVVCVLALAVATAFATQLGAPFGAAILAATLGAAAAALGVPFALSLVDRLVFSSRAQYKPTVEQLSEELISITSPEGVARAVERTIRRWLPCEDVELSLAERGVQALDSPSGLRRLDSPGPTSQRSPAEPIAVEFGGILLGHLRLGEKRGGALFTEDDLDLLRTIANQGALALAHAYAYQELEERRRQQAAAWRGERAALVETVAAELAHEIRYPINFFRSVFENAAGGRSLDSEDVDIGYEEVGRLERLVDNLRRMAGSRLERRTVRVDELCVRVEMLLRDVMGERGIEQAIPEQSEIRCDPDQVTQMLVNLVANGLQAAGPGGRVGIAWSYEQRAAELVVWDDGPGFDADPAKLFAPWYTTKQNGTGLGLAITHRLVRAHGWNITAARRDGRTCFVISIRSEDVVARHAGRCDDPRSAEVA
jgi:signal transduction histidine kinase